MMPLSYNGFGFTAILIMIGVLMLGQFFRYMKVKIESRPAPQKKHL
jgi:hypothetical protein